MIETSLDQAREIGRYWARLVQAQPAAQRMWVRAVRDYVELWLLTAPIEHDAELGLYEAADLVQDCFPEAPIRFGVLNPCHYDEGDALSALPMDAIEIPMRSA
jgi:hypothetical protein